VSHNEHAPAPQIDGSRANGIVDHQCSDTVIPLRAPAARTGGRPIKLRAGPIDFGRVNRAALAVVPSLLARWLPGGHTQGAEYVVVNPRRADHRPGSFRINTRTGRWADFAIECAPVAMWAYLDLDGRLVSYAARVEYERAGECKKDVRSLIVAWTTTRGVITRGVLAACRRRVRSIACGS
jgi:hypothetical protein